MLPLKFGLPISNSPQYLCLCLHVHTIFLGRCQYVLLLSGTHSPGFKSIHCFVLFNVSRISQYGQIRIPLRTFSLVPCRITSACSGLRVPVLWLVTHSPYVVGRPVFDEVLIASDSVQPNLLLTPCSKFPFHFVFMVVSFFFLNSY